MEIYAIKGGVRRLMANAILNFHFLRLPYVRVIYLEEKKRTILVGK